MFNNKTHLNSFLTEIVYWEKNMTLSIGNVVLSVVVAVVVTLACILLGMILVTFKVAVAVTVGDFLQTYSAVLGVLAGLYYLFTH